MKVAVTAEGDDLDAPIAPNFARCPYFVLVDSDSMGCESILNPWATAPSGAGTQAGEMVATSGAQAVITGMIGPRAFAVLQAAGVPVFSASGGTVRAAVQAYRAAHLLPLSEPNALPSAPFLPLGPGHVGPRGRPAGAGAKRGRRGSSVGRAGPSASLDDELAYLRDRAREVEAELAELQSRIRDLDKGTSGG